MGPEEYRRTSVVTQEDWRVSKCIEQTIFYEALRVVVFITIRLYVG